MDSVQSRAMSRSATQWVMSCVGVLVVSLCFAPAAFAAATFSNPQPLSVGPAVALNSVTVQVNADDPAGVTAATLLLDGVAKPVNLQYPVGYWDGDGCDSWYVPDTRKSIPSFRIPSLTIGSHTATFTVTNGTGAKSSYAWTFVVAPAATVFSGQAPANGSTIQVWDPEIAVVPDAVVDLADGPVIKVDGVTHAVPMRYGDLRITMDEWNDIIYNALPWEVPSVDFSKGYAAYRPVALADGAHSVLVSVGDATGRTATSAWSFTVAAPPQVTSPLPAAASSVSTQQPQISAKVEDNGSIASMKMLVDGVQVAASYNATTKLLSFTPATPLANDKAHTVRVEATDTGGLTGSLEWSFNVQVYADMSTSGPCEGCHDATKHPMNNCNACHGVVYIGHGLGARAETCVACHHVYSHGPNVIIPGVTWGGADDPQPGYTGYWGNYCDYCHSAKYPTIPRHPADNAAFHDTKTDVSSCAPCHVRSLTREHNRYSPNGTRLDCDTCHGASAPAKVKTAVAAGNSNCDACHDFTAGGDAHEALHKPDGLDQNCLTCHLDSLTQEHMNNPKTQTTVLGCSTCHSSTGTSVTWAVFAGDKSCSACHFSAHTLGLAPAPAGIPLFAGYRWSQPIDSALFAGESWLPAGFASGGKVVLSDRRTDVSAGDVFGFYRTQMAAKGWTLASPVPAADAVSFSATFTQGARTAVVQFFRSTTYGGPDSVRPGSRVQVLYR